MSGRFDGYAKIPAEHLLEAERVLVKLGKNERVSLGGSTQGERIVGDDIAIAYARGLIELANAQMTGRTRAWRMRA